MLHPPLFVNSDAFVNIARLHTQCHLHVDGMTNLITSGAYGLMQCCTPLCVDAYLCFHAVFTPTFVFANTDGPRYAVTEPLPFLLKHPNLTLPVLRDLVGSSYIRQEQKGLLVGPYETECVVRTEWPHGPPPTWGMELFPDNLDRSVSQSSY
jgi:hypothetical protein